VTPFVRSWLATIAARMSAKERLVEGDGFGHDSSVNN
jgi:hypothetical protein